MAAVLGPVTVSHLLLALLVLFGGAVPMGLLAFLLANVYFLPGPPSPWAFRAGIAGGVLGAVLSGVGLPLTATALLFADLVPLFRSATLALVGVGLYLGGLVWLEFTSRPEAEWT